MTHTMALGRLKKGDMIQTVTTGPYGARIVQDERVTVVGQVDEDVAVMTEQGTIITGHQLRLIKTTN